MKTKEKEYRPKFIKLLLSLGDGEIGSFRLRVDTIVSYKPDYYSESCVTVIRTEEGYSHATMNTCAQIDVMIDDLYKDR